MRLAAPCLTALCFFLLAGCGASSDDATASSDDPAPTATAVAAADGTTPGEPSPEPTPKPRTKNEIPSSGSDDFSAPVAAQGDDTERVPATTGLSLTAQADARTSWSLDASDDGDGAFCVTVKTRGITDPDPLCHSGTQLALSFFTDQAEAHALADVDLIAPDKSARPTDIVVAGVAAPDVKRVDATYAGKRYAGQLTRNSVRLAVDKQLAKEILDPTPEQLRTLPSSVTVRAFAITIPITKAAPPQRAAATSPVPVDGRMTFELS